MTVCFIDKADVVTGLQGIRDLWKKSDTIMQIKCIRSARRLKDKKKLQNKFGVSDEPYP